VADETGAITPPGDRRGPNNRWVTNPYRQRGDVGSIGVISGNWGGSRNQQDAQEQMDYDLKRNAASVLLLQEAQPELVQILKSPAVAGNPDGEGIQKRPGAEFLVLRAPEKFSSAATSKNTLIIAVRKELASRLRQLEWHRSCDAVYKCGSLINAHKTHREAYSRILVAEIEWRLPQCGSSTVVVACVHFHYKTAKKEKGHNFKEAHIRFWDKLASMVVEHQVRIIGGDFNMSLLVVCRELRDRGIQVSLGAW